MYTLCIVAGALWAAPQVDSHGIPDPRSEIQSREHWAVRGGRKIAVWEKSATSIVRKGPRRVAVVLPSASHSSRANFDLHVRDYSVMDALAREGWDVFAVDFLGYGKSDPPHEESYTQTVDAAKDLLAATDYICKLRNVPGVDLIGWSWGSQVAGYFAQMHPDKVLGLVLYGFSYSIRIPEEAFQEGALDKLYRDVTPEGARSDFVPGCHDPDVPEAYADACLLFGNKAPNGSLRDYVYELPVVDPEKLHTPTLLIYGQHELEGFGKLSEPEKQFFRARSDDAHAFLDSLHAPRKELAVIIGGGHAVHLEKPHLEWQRKVTDFLKGSEIVKREN